MAGFIFLLGAGRLLSQQSFSEKLWTIRHGETPRTLEVTRPQPKTNHDR
jgi:hypothetical protein